MEEKVLTLHPEGKQGVRICGEKYEAVRAAILDALRANPGMTFSALIENVGARLGDSFEGSVSWYVTTVKLDLEARAKIERVAGSTPQRLRLVSE